MTQLTATAARPKPPILQDDWLTEEDVARELNIAVKSVRMMRYRKTGPVYAKFGRAVRYQRSDLQRYKQERKVYPKDNPSDE